MHLVGGKDRLIDLEMILRNSQYSILIMTSNMKYNRSAIIQEITVTKNFHDKYMKTYIINNYKNGSGSLSTVPGKIGIWNYVDF